MTPAQLADSVLAAVRAAQASGDLVVDDSAVPTEIKVERPKNREHGDYATNIALQLAKPAGRPPREVAEAVAKHLAATPGVVKVDIAGPGFLNLTLDAAEQGEVAAIVVRAGTQYGRSDTLAGQRVNLEFISANPTGPLHLGHTRWAAVGDAMARVIEAAGAQVEREFYINDRGIQMDLFGASLEAAALGRPTPENGYHGAYIPDLATEIVAADPGIVDLPEGERVVAFREAGYRLQLADQQRVLDTFRTHFDVWASERALHESGSVDTGLAKLRTQGHVFDLDGAVWLRTTDFGDDKDRVLVKANGDLTYFASDTAYYLDKRASDVARAAAAAAAVAPAVPRDGGQRRAAEAPMSAPKSKEDRRREAEDRQVKSRERRELQTRVTALEKAIHNLEAKQQSLTDELQRPETHQSSGRSFEISQEMTRVGGEVHRLTKEWEAAATRLAAL